MKATIEFNLPEEQSEYEEFQGGIRSSTALRELAEQLRAYVKYGTDEKPTWEGFREMLWRICNENEVRLD